MTTVQEVALVLATVSTKLCTGLSMTILAFFESMLKGLVAPEFTLVVQRFHGVVRTRPVDYGLVTTSVLAPVAALVLLRGSVGSSAFVLAGLLASVAGPVLVSRFFAEPIYYEFSNREIESPPEDRREARPLLPARPGASARGCLRSVPGRPDPGRSMRRCHER